MVDTGASVDRADRDAMRRSSASIRRGTISSPRSGPPTEPCAPPRATRIGARSAIWIVRDVAALVLPDEALSENLLGLSFLSRLRRFEYSDGKLVLEQ